MMMERLRAILVGGWRLAKVSWCDAEGALRLAFTAAAFAFCLQQGQALPVQRGFAQRKYCRQPLLIF
jgi:hypothetical protein